MKFWGEKLSILALITLLAVQTMSAWAGFFAEDGQRLEICTPQGIKTVTFDKNGIATEQTGDESSEHCPLLLARDMVPVTPYLALSFLEFNKTKIFNPHTHDHLQTDQHKHDPFSSRDPPWLS